MDPCIDQDHFRVASRVAQLVDSALRPFGALASSTMAAQELAMGAASAQTGSHQNGAAKHDVQLDPLEWRDRSAKSAFHSAS